MEWRSPMAIPKLNRQQILDALKWIDETGVPEHHASIRYVLVSQDGKQSPPNM